MRERKSLIPSNTDDQRAEKGVSEPFATFTPKKKSREYVNAEQINEIASQHGFTSREHSFSTVEKKPYSENLAFRAKEGMKDLVNDICYHHKLKKQELMEVALLAFLESKKDKELLEKLKYIM